MGQRFTNGLHLMRNQGVGRASPGTGVFAYKRQIIHSSYCKGSRFAWCLHVSPLQGACFSSSQTRSIQVESDLLYPFWENLDPGLRLVPLDPRLQSQTQTIMMNYFLNLAGLSQSIICLFSWVPEEPDVWGFPNLHQWLT